MSKAVTPVGFSLTPEDIPASTRKSVYNEQINSFISSGEKSVHVGFPPDMKVATVIAGLRRAAINKSVRVVQKHASVYLQLLEGE